MEGPRPQKGSDIIYQAASKGSVGYVDPIPARGDWWPAKVTKVDPENMMVTLVYFWTGGLAFRTHVPYDENRSPCSWRWP